MFVLFMFSLLCICRHVFVIDLFSVVLSLEGLFNPITFQDNFQKKLKLPCTLELVPLKLSVNSDWELTLLVNLIG